MSPAELCVVLDEWVRPGSPASASSPVTWTEYCFRVWRAAPPWERNRWVMNLPSYLGLRAEIPLAGRVTVLDDLFGIPLEIRDSGGLPHLE